MRWFETLEIALAVLPAIITVGALAFWWRALQRRALFGTTSFLALIGMYSFIRRLVVGVAMVNFVPAPGTSMASESERVLALVDAAHTRRSIVAMAILLVAGESFLVWLRRAFAPR